MLDTGHKAEIEILSAPRTSGPYRSGGPHALAAYVHDKILDSLQALGSNTENWIKDEQDMDYAAIKVEHGKSIKVEDVDMSNWSLRHRRHGSLDPPTSSN